MKNYLKHHEWQIIEEGFDPHLNRISESVFSLGNGRMGHRANFEEYQERHLRYAPEMQFVLVDKDKRIFQARRFCYRSWKNDWIDIGNPNAIETVSKEFIHHIGKQSYFELF